MFQIPKRPPTFALLCVMALASCSNQQAASKEERNLTHAQLLNAGNGNTYRYTGRILGAHFSGSMTFNENQNLYVETDSGLPEGGIWRIAGNKLCLRLANLRQGKENCFTIKPDGKNGYITSHGFTISPPPSENDARTVIY